MFFAYRVYFISLAFLFSCSLHPYSLSERILVQRNKSVGPGASAVPTSAGLAGASETLPASSAAPVAAKVVKKASVEYFDGAASLRKGITAVRVGVRFDKTTKEKPPESAWDDLRHPVYVASSDRSNFFFKVQTIQQEQVVDWPPIMDFIHKGLIKKTHRRGIQSNAAVKEVEFDVMANLDGDRMEVNRVVLIIIILLYLLSFYFFFQKERLAAILWLLFVGCRSYCFFLVIVRHDVARSALFDVQAFKDRFQSYDDGLPALQFVACIRPFMPDHIPGLTEHELITALLRFFDDVDINGDGGMEWEEFTGFVIDAGMNLADLSKIDHIPEYCPSPVLDTSYHDKIMSRIEYFPLVDHFVCWEKACSSFRVYDGKSGRLWHLVDGHADDVLASDFVSGRYVATSGSDRFIKFWDPLNKCVVPCLAMDSFLFCCSLFTTNISFVIWLFIDPSGTNL